MNDLSGKIALVTGASCGIGRAIAVRLASLGAVVTLNHSGPEAKAEEVRTEIEVTGGKAFLIQVNASEETDVPRMFEEVLSKENRIDILVNNAGITRDSLLIGMKEAQSDEVLKTNLYGAYFRMQQAAKKMLRQKSGRIVDISSYSGLHGNVGQMNYAATKADLVEMTKTAARELGSRGITVNAVALGFIDTDMTAVLSDKSKEAILSDVPLGCMGNADDVTAAVAFLAGDGASYITGQVLFVDGGLSI